MTRVKEANDITALPAIAEWVLDHVHGRLIAIEGEMGAGKTTFVRELCRQLGVQDEVSSPTFSLVNEYYSSKHGSVYHFDFYRMKDEDEAMDIGLEDYLSSGYFCIMEWPEKIRNFLPEECAVLRIGVQQEKRIFELNTHD